MIPSFFLHYPWLAVPTRHGQLLTQQPLPRRLVTIQGGEGTKAVAAKEARANNLKRLLSPSQFDASFCQEKCVFLSNPEPEDAHIIFSGHYVRQCQCLLLL